MNFQNFYILISSKINSKKFIYIFISIIFISLCLSLFLNRLDLTLTNNDLIRKYQLSKIEKMNKDVYTIIVGDSSAGNAINAKYFSKLSGLKTENLSLTGSWGILGSLGILKKTIKKNKHIKNIIIIQTLDIWHREYPTESFIELFPFNEIQKTKHLPEAFSYYLNQKEIWWNIKYLFKKTINTKIDFENDYILQKDKKYSNNLKAIKTQSLNKLKISEGKIIELKMLQDFCLNNKLNCIFANGPIHQEIKDNSKLFNIYIKNHIKKMFEINFIDKIFSYANYKMGDSNDHVDVKYKDEVTLDYYLELKKYLK